MSLFGNTASEKTLMLDTGSLIPNPMQPRKNFDRDELSSLSQSIKKVGIIQPITVKKQKNGSRYEIIAGERRWRAAIIAGIKKIPCYVIKADRKHSSLMAFIENSVRSDLSCFEEADAIRELMLETKMTQSELSDALSMSQSALSNKLRLLKLSERERLMAIKYNFSERHIRALIRIENESERGYFIQKIIKENLTSADTEKMVEDYLKNPVLRGESNDTKPVKPKLKLPVRKGVIRDIRFFYNTIERSVTLLNDAGINTEWQKSEDTDSITVTVKIDCHDRRSIKETKKAVPV